MRDLKAVSLLLLVTGAVTLALAGKKDKPEFLTSYMTTGGEAKKTDDLFKRTDETAFKHEDLIYYFANFTWEDVERDGGRHEILYKWYSNGKCVGAPKWKGVFKAAPWEVRSTMVAATLGYGDHKVELYLDGDLVDTKEFKVVR